MSSIQNVEVIFSTKEERRARLGVIAVSEKIFNFEGYGDFAVDLNYLTDGRT